MKKNLYLLVWGFAITFLLGSCKSLTNLSIEKRQHRGGYYVDWGNGKVKTDPARNTSAKAKQLETPEKNTTVKQESKPVRNTGSSAATEQKKSEVNKTTVNNPEEKKVRSTTTFKVKEEAIAQRESAAKETSSSFSYHFSDNDKAKPDMPDWAWILLCLIPPLAVALWFDGITTEFWISLILTLLFWLPGFIYAIIVIF